MLEILNECIVFHASIKYTLVLYIGGRVCNTSMCTIQVNKVGLKPTTYYTLTAALKLKVDVRQTLGC